MPGVPSLREAIAEKTERLQGRKQTQEGVQGQQHEIYVKHPQRTDDRVAGVHETNPSRVGTVRQLRQGVLANDRPSANTLRTAVVHTNENPVERRGLDGSTGAVTIYNIEL